MLIPANRRHSAKGGQLQAGEMEFNVLIILWLISTMAKTIEGNGCVSTNAGKCQKGTKGFLHMTLLI